MHAPGRNSSDYELTRLRDKRHERSSQSWRSILNLVERRFLSLVMRRGRSFCTERGTEEHLCLPFVGCDFGWRVGTLVLPSKSDEEAQQGPMVSTLTLLILMLYFCR